MDQKPYTALDDNRSFPPSPLMYAKMILSRFVEKKLPKYDPQTTVNNILRDKTEHKMIRNSFQAHFYRRVFFFSKIYPKFEK